MSAGSFFIPVSKLLLKASGVKDMMGKCMTLAVRLWSSHTFYFLKLLYQEWSGLQNVNWKENVYLMEQCISLCGREALTVPGRWGWEPTAAAQALQWVGLGRLWWCSGNFALWSQKCPRVQSLCVCTSTCKHKLSWGVCCTDSSKDIYSKLLYGTWQRVYVCIACTHLHTRVLYKSLEYSGQRKLMWMKNLHQ